LDKNAFVDYQGSATEICITTIANVGALAGSVLAYRAAFDDLHGSMMSHTVGHDAVLVWVGLLLDCRCFCDHFTLESSDLLNGLKQLGKFTVLISS